MKAALQEGLKVVLCVGETLEERKSGNTFRVVENHLSVLTELDPSAVSADALVVAYEPVWAIGTGENATPEQAQEVHEFIREWAAKKFSVGLAARLRILYGGSVKPENAGPIMAQKDVDGLLVGSASLEPATFAGVVISGLKSRT
jgi:triosephosphate isomerase